MNFRNVVGLLLLAASASIASQTASASGQTCTHSYDLYELLSDGENVGWDLEHTGTRCEGTPGGPGWNPPDLGGPTSGGGDQREAEDPKDDDYLANKNPAPCTANAEERLWHAAHVFHRWRVRKFRAMIRAGKGDLIRVKFEGGGSEVYMWIPGTLPAHTRPPEMYLTRVPGSLSCNAGSGG